MQYCWFQKIKLFICIILCTACSSEPKTNVVDFNAALPHAEALPSKELSKEDQVKLSEAKGLVSETINEVDLSNIKAQAKDKLFIFNFWTLNCQDCKDNLKHLKDLNFDENKVMVLSINLDNVDKKEAINLHLRKNNIPFKSFQLKNLKEQWKEKFDPSWKGEGPAIFFINQSESIDIKYYKRLSLNELEAITQALIL